MAHDVDVGSMSVRSQGRLSGLITSGSYEPEILSSVTLPVHPTTTPSAVGAAGGPSNGSLLKYKHALLSQAVNPCMDLVALVSRDVDMSPSAGSAAGADPNAGLPPPPPGMSAARSQALMRMRMAARAKALAAAGIKPAEGGGTSGGSNGASPKVRKCASLRLSLWRMASVAGEQGARVWDVTISIPNRFEDVPGEEKELEDQSVDALSWSPDGLVLAIGVRVSRKLLQAQPIQRSERFVCLYALQDGQLIRIVPVPVTGAQESAFSSFAGMGWYKFASIERPVKAGSAEHVLSLLGPLPELVQNREDQEGKARQRQRLFQAMRDPKRPKAESDKKANELATSDPRGLGKQITEHPRALPDAVRPTAKVSSSSSQDREASVLCAWTPDEVFLFLDGTILLGSMKAHLSEQISTGSFDVRTGDVWVAGSRPHHDKLCINRISSYLQPSSPNFECLLHLRTISTFSYDLTTYCYDAAISMRSAYRTMHTDCIAPWNRRARLTAKRYATHLHSELMMLLATGYANDTMMSVLLGNDTLSENDLNKMKADVLSGFTTLESTATRCLAALQRLILVYEELKGCSLWVERYGLFFGAQHEGELNDAGERIGSILKNANDMARLTMRFVRMANQEHLAWSHFYRWWFFERTRQEALRDNKSPTDALAAAGADTAFNAVILGDFIRRGFDNLILESVLGIEMDASARGDEVEDDDDDEGEDNKSRINVQRRVPVPTEDGSTVPEVLEQADYRAKRGAWYRDEDLHAQIERSRKALQQPPNADDLFSTVGKKAPSPADVARLADEQALFLGPTHGLDERLRQHKAPAPKSLSEAIAATIALAAPLFCQMFSRWSTQHDFKSPASAPAQATQVTLLNTSVAPSRADGLFSDAKGERELDTTASLRSLLVTSRDEYRVAVVEHGQDGSCSLLIVVTPLFEEQQQRSDPLTGTTAVRIALGASHVHDFGFYSPDEMVLLLEKHAENDGETETILASVRVDSLALLPVHDVLDTQIKGNEAEQEVHAHRCVQLKGDGGRAKKLALNRSKEVCATLDDEGYLAYWDMVLQHRADEGGRVGQTEEQDGEMR